MDSLDSNKGFFKYVFNFDDSTKSELLNIIQFSVLSLIPVISLNKAMQRYVPEADEQKGSVEILAEIIIQTMVLFLGIFFVYRLVSYVPTYSETKYPDFSVVNIILIGLVILLSLQTKLGEKVGILSDRIAELWEGPSVGKKEGSKKSGSVKVTQPISQPNSQQMAITQSLYSNQGNSTSLSQLPNYGQGQGQGQGQSQQKMPDYNSTYVNANDASALIGNTSPGMESMMNMQNGGFNEPMAANAVLGGSAFGSNF